MLIIPHGFYPQVSSLVTSFSGQTDYVVSISGTYSSPSVDTNPTQVISTSNKKDLARTAAGAVDYSSWTQLRSSGLTSDVISEFIIAHPYTNFGQSFTSVLIEIGVHNNLATWSSPLTMSAYEINKDFDISSTSVSSGTTWSPNTVKLNSFSNGNYSLGGTAKLLGTTTVMTNMSTTGQKNVVTLAGSSSSNADLLAHFNTPSRRSKGILFALNAQGVNISLYSVNLTLS